MPFIFGVLEPSKSPSREVWNGYPVMFPSGGSLEGMWRLNQTCVAELGLMGDQLSTDFYGFSNKLHHIHLFAASEKG